MLSLALYQPEIAHNLGASIRIAACFGVPLHVIEPCGFPWRDRDISRVSMDYQADIIRHRDWATFKAEAPGRLVLATTKAAVGHTAFAYSDRDILLLGQESSGVPQKIHDDIDLQVRIQMAPGARSLNLSVAAAVILAEANRQLQRF
ncbi:MAG: TrmH family RNA methyltransferase [Pseudomonadota bacterium]